jgi:hypothetical protein
MSDLARNLSSCLQKACVRRWFSWSWAWERYDPDWTAELKILGWLRKLKGVTGVQAQAAESEHVIALVCCAL